MERRRSTILVITCLLILTAFSVRAASLDGQSLWRDEVDSLRFAGAPWSEMVSNFTRPGWNGPLYHVLLRGWIAITGTSEYAMRFSSLFFGVLSVPLTYVLARRLFNPLTGLMSALLVAGSAYLVWYSQEVKMYTLVLALTLLSIYSFHRALEGGGCHWWLAQITAAILVLYLHILAALLVPVLTMLSIAWWARTRRHWRAALASFAGLILPYLPLVQWQAPLALEVRETGFSSYSLDQMIVILLNGWSTGIGGWGSAWSPVFLSLLSAGGLLGGALCLPHVARPGEEARSLGSISDRLAVLIWMAVPLFSVWLISLRQPLFTDRYLIWVAPAFYLLVALGLSCLLTVKKWTGWLVALLLAVFLTVNGVNIWKQATIPIKSDFRAAAAYVASFDTPVEPVQHRGPATPLGFRYYLPIVLVGRSAFDDLIIFHIPYGRHTFDYYFPIETYSWAEGLYTNHREPDGAYRMSEREAAWHMREMTKGHEAVWLIATEVATWDERNLVRGWLDEHLHVVSEAHFARVEVVRYARRDS